MSSSNTDEDEFDLGISTETVATVVDYLRALQEDEDSEAIDPDEEPEEGEDDFDESTLSAFIEELNEDEQAALVALSWVGRGDYEPEQWEEAMTLARERAATGSTADYLMKTEMAGDLLAEGLAAFDIAVEDVER
ncbi:DUF3775 domain-containing protein [Roseomonas haemaphysalidis]|uniref:DUF3775 domain-containing protein n=1 Tax=Roseomonas haemaphysalidis TaxID=2768162 RepID=A0ABS3KRT5_9PROT|nr:DUF3775 domain-containing protein [Roseomonas haemaphysalidis]MBO1079742.1 DUF3775 domain-containing protein [Roseomonas haemaphysalidis]